MFRQLKWKQKKPNSEQRTRAVLCSNIEIYVYNQRATIVHVTVRAP